VTDLVAVGRRLAPRFAARAAAHDRDNTFPEADFADLRSEGLTGLMVPTRLGGLGAGFGDYADLAYELARGSGATALVFFDARDDLLRRAAGGAWFAVAMSERGAGSRLSRVATSYRREDGGFRITGSKTFVSGAGHADGYLVVARSADDPDSVSQFLVLAGTPGVRVEPTWDSLGMRATGSHDVHFDAHVEGGALLGGVEGLALWFAQLMPHWLVASYAAVYVGVARAAIDAAVEHLTGRKLDGLPSVRARVGRADAAVAAARLVVAEAARRVDAAPGDPDTNRWVWRAKLLAGTTAMEVAASMLEAAGTSASRRGHPLERLYRDARCGSLQPATSDVCADWLGIAALGGDPDRDGSAPRW
jgi:alkylation response protein AidB-like acyl-CoA dehydrogenase